MRSETKGRGRVGVAAAWLGVVVAFGAACGTTSATAPELLEPTKTGDAFQGVQCSAIRPPTEPDLMGWDSGSRGKLKTLQEQGVVAVRYRAEGCNIELQVLNCVGEGEYRFSPYNANETKVAKSAQELFANLPIGAASLQGKLAGGRALRTDYMLAGLLTLPVMESYPVATLKGDCKLATHVVSALYLGGFALAVGESERIAAGASLFGVGAGADSQRSAERLSNEGDAEACARAQKEAKREATCSVPLRIGLVAIEGRAEGGCPEGSRWNGKECVPVVAALPPAVSPPQPQGWGNCPSGMAAIPAGSFMMGSNDGGADEKPVHRVTLSGYCMDVYEVSVADFGRCVSAGSCTASTTVQWYGLSAADRTKSSAFCNWGKSDRANHPINCVDWDQATAYCAWAKKRLPTEEEWEYAARGTDGRTYPWGNAEPSSQLCWQRYGDGKPNSTCTVGQYVSGKSPFGLFDMAGNVWEWTSSGYSADYSKNRTNSSRVLRGGSWGFVDPRVVRSALRSRGATSGRDGSFGFRCARAK